MTQKDKIQAFRAQIWAFYGHSGRQFQWRKMTNPYKILVSEIMLQQTQVDRVVEKFPEFLKAFPTIKTLAEAPLSHVLMVWQGMGYNRRALALKRLAEEIIQKHKGHIPHTREALEKLHGVGKYTAGAVRAFAFNEPEVFIETNIRRVFIHHFFPRRTDVTDKEIMPFVEASLDTSRPREWYWALMDYGSYLPKIVLNNPNKKSKHYVAQKKFEGSHRQMRGKVLMLLNTKGKCHVSLCAKTLKVETAKAQMVLNELMREEFIQKDGKIYTIKN